MFLQLQSIITQIDTSRKNRMMEIQTFIVDSFTNKPFSGNPAGVCLLESELEDKIMQSIASELNLSETAFLIQNTNNNQYGIRFFTPTVEIDFCGHATLACAKIILSKSDKNNIEFITRKGLEISAESHEDYIKMNFPLYETIEYKPNRELFDAFGIVNPISLGYCQELDVLLIEVEDKKTLLNIAPDYHKALKSSDSIKEVVVTTKSDDNEYDFYSRCFCPWIGIDEDPATGATHSILAKYWGKKLNKQKMSAFQLSSRGGFLNLKIVDENNLEVYSNAQVVFEGKLKIE